MREWRLLHGRTLTQEAGRVLDAIERMTLGFNVTSAAIGREMLRELTGLHGRSVDRAIGELVDLGLDHTPGRRGGARARFDLEPLLAYAARERHLRRTSTRVRVHRENAAEQRRLKCRSGAATKGASLRSDLPTEGTDQDAVALDALGVATLTPSTDPLESSGGAAAADCRTAEPECTSICDGEAWVDRRLALARRHSEGAIDDIGVIAELTGWDTAEDRELLKQALAVTSRFEIGNVLWNHGSELEARQLFAGLLERVRNAVAA
jgi:hypothetical protein